MVSYKVRLMGNSSNFSFNSEVKFSKIKGIDLSNRIIIRDSAGLLVKSASLVDGQAVRFNRGFVDENGNPVNKSELHYFIEGTDGEKEIAKFSRTKEMNLKFVPSEFKHNLIFSSTYEVFGENLVSLAKHLSENNLIGVGKFSFGNGFKQYLAIIEPIFIGDKFVFKMSLSDGKLEYKNLMEVNQTIKEKKAVPTLDLVGEIMGC